jgi:hypothetical protein
MAPLDKYRLPVNVEPRHYDVTIWTDLKTFKFGGFVNIRRAEVDRLLFCAS